MVLVFTFNSIFLSAQDSTIVLQPSNEIKLNSFNWLLGAIDISYAKNFKNTDCFEAVLIYSFDDDIAYSYMIMPKYSKSLQNRIDFNGAYFSFNSAFYETFDENEKYGAGFGFGIGVKLASKANWLGFFETDLGRNVLSPEENGEFYGRASFGFGKRF